MNPIISSAPSAASATMDPGLGQPPLRPAGEVRDDDYRPDLVGPCPIGQVSVTAADDAVGADANADFRFG